MNEKKRKGTAVIYEEIKEKLYKGQIDLIKDNVNVTLNEDGSIVIDKTGPSVLELRRTYIERVLKQARDSYKDHELIDRGDRWFHIARRYEDGKVRSDLATDIFCGCFGEITVGGDLNTMVFAYFGDSKQIEPRLRWIGRNKDLEYYVAQKAAIGMTDNGVLTTKFDPQIAIAELKEHPVDSTDELNTIMDVIEMLESGETNFNLIYHELYIGLNCTEDLSNLGKVLSPRVIYAYVAIEKLCDLLGL